MSIFVIKQNLPYTVKVKTEIISSNLVDCSRLMYLLQSFKILKRDHPTKGFLFIRSRFLNDFINLYQVNLLVLRYRPYYPIDHISDTII